MGSCYTAEGAQLSSVLSWAGGWDGEGGRREVQEGGYVCLLTADSLPCTAETNTAL